MEKKYTISVFTENHPGVLHRVTANFTRQMVNIDSLTVCETQNEGISRFTIAVQTEPDKIEKISKTIPFFTASFSSTATSSIFVSCSTV